MQKFILFLTLLISHTTRLGACAEYFPYNEEIRFRLFYPAITCHCNMDRFRFTGHLFSQTPSTKGCDNADENEGQRLNIALWQEQLNQPFTYEQLYNAFYELQLDNINNSNHSNAFVRFLHQKDQADLLTYIRFMHTCTFFNTEMSDPWERNEDAVFPERERLIAAAREHIKSAPVYLKKRHAFLAIRLAAYNNNNEVVKTIYAEHFSQHAPSTILDYWALYFLTQIESPGPERNLHAAMVFDGAPDKRLRVYAMYDTRLPIASVLALAKNDSQKAAVYLLSGVTNPGRAFETLSKLHQLQPNHSGVELLVNRELNKIEFWLLTPRYTGFKPNFEYEEPAVVKGDKAYAKLVFDFLDNHDGGNKFLVQRTYLAFLTGQLTVVEKYAQLVLSDPKPNSATKLFINEVKCLTHILAGDMNGTPLEADLQTIKSMQAVGDNRFLLAAAKELEAQKNFTLSTLLFAKVNRRGDDWEQYVYWMSNQHFQTGWFDMYYTYFLYYDGHMSEGALTEVLAHIERFKKSGNSSQHWLYAESLTDLPRLYDLLGTKYLRQNQLDKALANYREVPDSIWESPRYQYQSYLNANPFYTNAYQEHETSKFDTIRYTKTELLVAILNYLNKANNDKNPDRDYHYYLLGNCYFNMTQYGNSWMMRRYYWTMYPDETGFVDNQEYFECDLAKAFYLKGYETATSENFKALCLRMAGRCEKFKRYHQLSKIDTDDYQQRFDDVFRTNKYYRLLKKKFPTAYDEFFAYCESVDKYQLKRRNQLSLN